MEGNKSLLNFNQFLPESVIHFIQICQKEGLNIYLYGSALTDFFLNKEPNDYDFDLLCTKEKLFQLAQKYQLKIKQHGDYIYPADNVFYTFLKDQTKIDIACFDKHFSLTNIHKTNLIRGNVTITSFFYDCQNQLFSDPFNGMKDLQSKTIRFNSKIDIDSEKYIKAFLIYVSYLHGKYETFSLDEELFPIIKNSINQYERYEYFKNHPWRIATTLVRCFSYSTIGINNIADYWKKTGTHKILASFIDEKELFEIMYAKTNGLDKLIQINQSSKNKLANLINTSISEIHPAYLECMDKKANEILNQVVAKFNRELA